MGHVESKTMSQGKILEKPCVRRRGLIFGADSDESWSECLTR